MKTVLIISYYWPPAGGPGVQRPLKFARYLHELGWKVVVLTVKDGVYPARDDSLLEEIPSEIKVFKSFSPEPEMLLRKLASSDPRPSPVGVLAEKPSSFHKRIIHHIRLNYFIPDAKVMWRYNSRRLAERLVQLYKPDIVFSTSPPPTTHLIAYDIKKRFPVRWVADFRDPWSRIHYYRGQRSAWAEKWDQRLERKVLNACDQILCVSRAFAGLLVEQHPDKTAIIPNGYDAGDFASRYRKTERFNMLYIGGLNRNRWYASLFKTIIAMLKEGALPEDKVRLTLAGNIAPAVLAELRTIFADYPEILQIKDYVPHQQATTMMQQADLLLLFMEKVDRYQGHLPGKLFEYLAAMRPVLGCGPADGEAAALLEELGAGRVVDSPEEMKDLIGRAYTDWVQGIAPAMDRKKVENWERRNLTRQLAALFEKVLAR